MNKKGFTLTEILVVVIMITSLAVIAYPSYRTSIEHARASEAVNMIATIQAAQQKHLVNYEVYGDKYKDINDFAPTIENFNSDTSFFLSDYFKYSLGDGGDFEECAIAERVNDSGVLLNKGYKLIGCYADTFIRCYVLDESEDGEKVCSSLTDRQETGTSPNAYYPIF